MTACLAQTDEKSGFWGFRSVGRRQPRASTHQRVTGGLVQGRVVDLALEEEVGRMVPDARLVPRRGHAAVRRAEVPALHYLGYRERAPVWPEDRYRVEPALVGQAHVNVGVALARTSPPSPAMFHPILHLHDISEQQFDKNQRTNCEDWGDSGFGGDIQRERRGSDRQELSRSNAALTFASSSASGADPSRSKASAALLRTAAACASRYGPPFSRSNLLYTSA